MGSSYSKPAEVESKIFPDFIKSMLNMSGKVVAVT